jgi:galactokinase
MANLGQLIDALEGNGVDHRLAALYGAAPQHLADQKERYLALAGEFKKNFPGEEVVSIFSTPGRTEVGGNHTDHNHGRVLAAAVDLDLIAIVSKRGDGVICVQSEGYPRVIVDTRDLVADVNEKYTTAALIRGVCARLKELGYAVGGFNACITSQVPKGSGLSSSAAFEVEIVTILNHLYNAGKVDAVLNAIISQYAENHYFGKPSGLMDQTTASVGGFVTIDFLDPKNPLVHKVAYDFSKSGYALVIVETGGSHADLNEDYAGITADMRAVANFFGKNFLREVTKEQMVEALPTLHKAVSDRAILRAFHFFDDDQRVLDEVAALEANRFDLFLDLVKESGRSSWLKLQNCYSTRDVTEQGIPLAQTVTENLLQDTGAWRVHGGGFAGTIQVFVPFARVGAYVEAMEVIFGKGSCYPISIRSDGSIQVDLV